MDAPLMLSREAILGFKDDNIAKVEVPELGGEVCVARLTAAEADKIRSLGDDCPFIVGVAILGACDADGNRLFTDKDKAALSKLPATVVGQVSNAILKHNGLLGGDEAKNGSSETASDDSASASPSP